MKSKFSNKEHIDAALALLILLLLSNIFFKTGINESWFVAVLFLIMAVPVVFYPFTFLWLNISHFLGQVMSKVLLFIVFMFFVVPVAIFRRMLNKDSLKLRQFKKSAHSVFITRNHLFTKEDMQAPY